MGYWIAATLLAFFVKGLCGFANTLVFTSIMSFGANNINISPVELLVGYPANAMVAFRERKSIQWKMCLPIAALIIIGGIPGVFFLKNTDTHVLKIIFGILVIGVGVEMLLREFFPKKTKENKIVLTLIGIVTFSVFKKALTLVPFMVVGTLMGMFASKFLNEKVAKRIVIIFLMISGVSLVVLR